MDESVKRRRGASKPAAQQVAVTDGATGQETEPSNALRVGAWLARTTRRCAAASTCLAAVSLFGLLACGSAAGAPGAAPVDGTSAGGGGGAPPTATSARIPRLLGFSGAGFLPRHEPGRVTELLGKMGYSTEEAYFADTVSRMQDLRSPMARAEFYYVGGGQFVRDGIVSAMQTGGVELYGWVNPTREQETPDSKFEAGLERLLQEFPTIRTWQLGNEPDLLWADGARFPGFFARSQRVVRRVCPDCQIVLAGISNQYETTSENFRVFSGFLDELADAELSGAPFDVFDFHFYKAMPTHAEIEDAVRSYRGMLEEHGFEDVPFWCTETGVYAGDPPAPELPPRSEEAQAIDAVRLVAWLAAEGVERLYWWTVMDAPGAPGFFDSMGFFYDGVGEEEARGVERGTPKQAAATFARLAEVLRDVRVVEPVAAGVTRFDRLDTGSAFLLFDEGQGATVELTGLDGARVLVEDLVAEASGVRRSEELPIIEGRVRVEVGSVPKLVTELP